jgi:hypothetical protein
MRSATVLLLAGHLSAAEERRSLASLPGCREAVHESAKTALPEAGARKIAEVGSGEIWASGDPARELVIALTNRGPGPVSLDVLWSRLRVSSRSDHYPRVFNITEGKDWGEMQGGFSQRVDAGKCRLFSVRPPR